VEIGLYQITAERIQQI